MKHLIKMASTWFNTSKIALDIRKYHEEISDDEAKLLPKEKQADILKHSFKSLSPLSDIAKAERTYYNHYIATAKKYLFENDIFNHEMVYTDEEILEAYKHHTNSSYTPFSKQI